MDEVMQVRAAIWTAMIKQRNDSGLTIKEWCAANGIQESVYYCRLNRLGKMALNACETPNPTKNHDSSGTFAQLSVAYAVQTSNVAVKGKPVGVLLVHRPRNSGCRGRAFPNQGRRNMGLYDHRSFCISKAFSGGASITLAVVFNDFLCMWQERIPVPGGHTPRQSVPSACRRLDRLVLLLEEG